jgi:hypothetical protein
MAIRENINTYLSSLLRDNMGKGGEYMANRNQKPEFPLTPELSKFTFELAKEIGIDTKISQGTPKKTEHELDIPK